MNESTNHNNSNSNPNSNSNIISNNSNHEERSTTVGSFSTDALSFPDYDPDEDELDIDLSYDIDYQHDTTTTNNYDGAEQQNHDEAVNNYINDDDDLFQSIENLDPDLMESEITTNTNIYSNNNNNNNNNAIEEDYQLPIMDGTINPKEKTNINIHNNNETNTNDTNNNINIDNFELSEYILGTLIVRVAAARDLKPIPNYKQGAGNHTTTNNNNTKHKQTSKRRHLLFPNSNNHRNKSANPYACISFAGSSSSSSSSSHHHPQEPQVEYSNIVYDTTDPIWSRNEQFYFDVSLPVPILVQSSSSSTTTSNNSSSPDSNDEKDYLQMMMDRDSKTSGTKSTITTKMKKKENTTTTCTIEDIQKIASHLPLPKPPEPILTVAILHSDHTPDSHYNYDCKPSSSNHTDSIYPNKKYHKNIDNDDNDTLLHKSHHPKSNNNNNNTDEFLGMTTLNLSSLINGKTSYIDEWLPLYGDQDITGQVRIICEYEPTDPCPRPGDLVRLTGFVQPLDVYPLPPCHVFQVDQVLYYNDYFTMNDNDDDDSDDNVIHASAIAAAADGKFLILSYYTTPEKWRCTFQIHRNMVICTTQHQTALERYQDELFDFVERISTSTALQVVQDTCDRLPEDGLLGVGVDVMLNSVGLIGRWARGGLGLVVEDLVSVWNLDGEHDAVGGGVENNTGSSDEDDVVGNEGSNVDEVSQSLISLDTDDDDLEYDDNEYNPTTTNRSHEKIPTNKMPYCPISGQPMKHPVVAADGHTYERAAIARWLRTSDKSPLTGSKLPHKELVPNYLLLSTLNEKRESKDASGDVDDYDDDDINSSYSGIGKC